MAFSVDISEKADMYFINHKKAKTSLVFQIPHRSNPSSRISELFYFTCTFLVATVNTTCYVNFLIVELDRSMQR